METNLRALGEGFTQVLIMDRLCMNTHRSTLFTKMVFQHHTQVETVQNGTKVYLYMLPGGLCGVLCEGVVSTNVCGILELQRVGSLKTSFKYVHGIPSEGKDVFDEASLRPVSDDPSVTGLVESLFCGQMSVPVPREVLFCPVHVPSWRRKKEAPRPILCASFRGLRVVKSLPKDTVVTKNQRLKTENLRTGGSKQKNKKS